MARIPTSNKSGMTLPSEVEAGLPCGNFKLKNCLKLQDLKTGAAFEIDSAIEHSRDDVPNAINSSPGVEQSFDHDENEIYDSNLLGVLAGVPNSLAGCSTDYNSNSLSDCEDDYEPFDKLERRMEDISGDDGVLKMELQPGIGPDIPDGAQVFFHYSAYLEYSDEPFDSSVLRKHPQKSNLNTGDTLKGLNIGLRTMKKKERARFLIKPDYAYGQVGCPPRIPPNAVILYEVTLVNWIDRTGADVFENMNDEQQRVATFEQKMKAAKDYHKEGNESYKRKQFMKAKSSYKRAAWILENTLAANEEEQDKQTEFLFRMHSNLAQVNLDLKEPGKAISECRLAFDFPAKVSDELKAKLYFRYAKAKMYVSDFASSKKYFLRAQRLRPNNSEIPRALEELYKKMALYQEREKVLCRKMIGMAAREAGETPPTEPEFEPVDSDVQEILRSQVVKFSSDRSRNELPLPPSMTESELRFVSSVSEELKVNLEKYRIGSSVFWKIIRQ